MADPEILEKCLRAAVRNLKTQSDKWDGPYIDSGEGYRRCLIDGSVNLEELVSAVLEAAGA